MENEKGQFKVFRGISLPQSVIEEWKRKKIVSLDGYSSTTKKEHIAKKFAAMSELTSDDD